MRPRKIPHIAGLKAGMTAFLLTAVLTGSCFAAELTLPDRTAYIEDETLSVELALGESIEADSYEFTLSYDTEKLILDHIDLPGEDMSIVYVASKDRWLVFSSADTDLTVDSLGTAVFTLREKGETTVSACEGAGVSFVNAMADKDPVTVSGDELNLIITCKSPGDIDSSGGTDLLDLVRLMKWFAVSGTEVEVNEPALDVNGDGVRNTSDLIRLMEYLADPENVIIY